MRNKRVLFFIITVIFVVLIIVLWVSRDTATDTEAPEKIVVSQSGGMALLIAECADPSYLTDTADYIIEGTVKDVESLLADADGSVFTYSDLDIERYLKGVPFSQTILQIATPGGTVGEITQVVEDQPIFHKNKRVRVYMTEEDTGLSLVCAQAGVVELE